MSISELNVEDRDGAAVSGSSKLWCRMISHFLEKLLRKKFGPEFNLHVSYVNISIKGDGKVRMEVNADAEMAESAVVSLLMKEGA